MSWFGRKPQPQPQPDHDPRIDFARESLESPQGAFRKKGARRERAAGDPGAVDIDFCYGGDSGPCA